MCPNKSGNENWQDPQAEREADRYARPVPSRERIIEVIKSSLDVEKNQAGLMEFFSLHADVDRIAFQRRVSAMLREGQLLQNKKGVLRLAPQPVLIKGKVRAHADGYGFLIVEGETEDWTLTVEEMQQVFDGDVVLAQEAGFDRRGRRIASIRQVVQRNTTMLVGRYTELGQVAYVVPDHPRIIHEVLVRRSGISVEPGQLVVIQITQQPGLSTKPEGLIVEVLGDYRAPGLEIDIAVRTFGVPFRFPEAVEQEVALLLETVSAAETEGRVDIRHLPLVTIDGEDARDFDDAVFVQRRPGGGFRLLVAIADVGHYVRPGTALDGEALLRGTSVYFPGSVIPMLPEKLSNGLCSLKPEVDRLCLVCDMTFSRQGRRTGYQFYWSVMHSQARLTYAQVQYFLEHGTLPDREVLKNATTPIGHSLMALNALYQLLRTAREARGALDFEVPETQIVFTAERKIDSIVPRLRSEAHRLIEEAMLAANVCAAEWAITQQIPVLFRNHQGPTATKLQRLQAYLGLLGLSLPKTGNPTPKQLHELLEKIKTRPDRKEIENMVLRSMAQAFYGPENLGHFGLHFSAYAHFTSPIRRYPDLLLHRALAAFAQQQTTLLGEIRDHLGVWGEHCSMTERRADEATRDVVSWLKCDYMQDQVGEEFIGKITSVTSFGFFVELQDIFVDGLVHVSRLTKDFYTLDERRQVLVGEWSGREFRMGQQLVVQVISVDLDQRRIDFALASAPEPKGSLKDNEKNRTKVKKNSKKTKAKR